ncbi:MAG: hypothetical protein EVJ46_00100 [Candidatus Acididesulfobacter guangdongensis]|uniref:Lipoprotein n=1 Tax=Acididesulfobacter guangdongensis TaxID=2597225 RepID=A0A519BHD0_ACIG2|nr:MAG: hypothetical protein EVJ46_00100 [Candidatus Acididesulfobacter guangdongensis]
MTIIKKILLMLSIAGTMAIMAGCAYSNSNINNHKLNKTEQYKLGIKADKLEGLPVISSAGTLNKKIQGVKNGK